MARKLTKKKKNGDLYVRPPEVETSLALALTLSPAAVIECAKVVDRKTSGYLRSECLLHLVREARRGNNDNAMRSLLEALLFRCERILNARLPDGSRPDAPDLREEILGRFGEMFAIDGEDEDRGYLDFFECKFNAAFKALRISVLRKATVRSERVEPLPDVDDAHAASDDSRFSQLSKSFSIPAIQHHAAECNEALAAMTQDEREAFSLVYLMGYEIESNDPANETAATRAKVTGRTIRSRLTRAIEKFKRYTESI
jgi:DNA-directed RNA polymerase specialized sigma24 family protein